MPTNEVRRELLNRAKASGYPGSITEVFQASDQGIDLIEQHQIQQQQQQMQVANTPQEQETGLREQHAAGNTDASMAFPDVQPNQSFNTVGMAAPIDIQKIDDQGHLVESYKNVPPGIQDLPTGPSEGTVIESPAAYQKGGKKRETVSTTQGSYYYNKDGSPMSNKQVAEKKKERRELSQKYFKEFEETVTDPVNIADVVGATGIPIVSEAGDAVSASISHLRGDKAARNASVAGIVAPFAGGAVIKQGAKGYNKLFKTQDPNTLYRVVDVPPGAKADEIATAAEYGTTIPPANIKNAGRRTGYENIQEQTDFDLLFTSPDQRWITEGPQYHGQAKPQNLLNLYGGQNPYVVKMSRGIGEESLDVINRRTDILKSRDLVGQKTRQIGAGVWEMKPYNLPGQKVNIGDIARVPPGSIVNPNYLSRFDKNNITTIFGPKGTKVREAQGVLSADEYIKRLRDNPDFKFNKGGFKSKHQVGGFNPAHVNPIPYNPLDERFPLRNTPFPQGRREEGAPWEVKKGIRAVESSDGKLMKNPNSSATGFYGQLYNEIKDLSFMEDINRDSFAADTMLQNKVFDMRWKGEIPGVPSLKGNIKKLRTDYGKLTSDFTDNELAVLSNYIGREGAREYFASIRDGEEFKMPGEDTGDNKSIEQYMKEYRTAIKKKQRGGYRLRKKGGYKSKYCW
jgi:uncharacterized membrane protein (UPF0127 family)